MSAFAPRMSKYLTLRSYGGQPSQMARRP